MGVRWGVTGQGVAQGDPKSGDFFCIGLQPSLVMLDSDCREGGGMARAGADDVCAIGPIDVVLPAVQRFSQEVWRRCRLRLQWQKTQMFAWDVDLPGDGPAGLTLAGEVVEGVFKRGFECYGILIGTPVYVKHMLQKKAEEVVRDANQTAHLLSVDHQALWSALRLSISHRFEYFCQLSPPSLVEPVAAWLDTEIWRILERATGLNIPRGAEGEMVIRCPVTGLDNLSYQGWLVRLPVKLYGWGLRSLQETCGPAYLGALETAIP